jgi:lipoprotein
MRKLLFSALMGAMIISCNRDNDNVSPAPTIDDPSILPTKFTYFIPGDDEEVITFSYDENKLVKLTQNNKDVIFTYTGNLITSIRSEDKYLEFGYDANGNLISEYEELYNQGAKINEKNTTYTINGSTITAEQTSGILGTERNTFVSTITYTLDAQKRPIKIVEASEQKDTWGKITQKDDNTFIYQYADHHSFLKNIKGLDKLYYSSLTIKKEKINGLVFPFSYTRGELITYLYDQPIGHYPSAEGYTYQTKAAYTLNTNGYPTKIAYKTRDTVTLGLYEDNGYYTIEYNK